MILYSYADRSNDQHLIRAEACAEIGSAHEGDLTMVEICDQFKMVPKQKGVKMFNSNN